jgi:hypothetical protein
MSVRRKLGFSMKKIIKYFKENFIKKLTIFLMLVVFILIVAVVRHWILYWYVPFKVIDRTTALATLFTVLILGFGFKKSIDAQEKIDKESEKQKLKEKLEVTLLEIVISCQDATKKEELIRIFSTRQLFLNYSISDYFADNILSTIKTDYRNFKEKSLTGDVYKRKFESIKNNLVIYFEQNEKLKKEFGEDETHAEIAQILVKTLPEFIQK